MDNGDKEESRGCTIYVLIDALGWEILRDRPFLEDILVERRAVETILGYSSGAIPTVLTGQYPSGHGHWNLFYRSAATSPFRWARALTWLPVALREWRGTRRFVKEVSKRLSGYSGYFAIYNLPLDRIEHFDLCETSDIYQPGALKPSRSIFDVFQEAGLHYECYNYHGHTDDEILSLMPGRIERSDCKLYFLYLAGLDNYLHFHVNDEEGITAQLRFYEDGLRRIYEAAKARWGDVRLTIVSDHGMTPIRKTVDLIGEVNRVGLRVPDDYLAVYDSTMARFWFETEDAQAQVSALLGELPYGRMLSAEETEHLGIAFEDQRYGEMVYLMNPGTLICPSDMGRTPMQGMHGFHPKEDPSSYAVFLSSEKPRRAVTHITEIFPTVLEDLNLS